MAKSVFIISGEKKTGKTFFLQKLISILSESEYELRGFYAQNDEITDSYHIINIRTHEKILLMTRVSQPDKRPIHFQINESAIPVGTDWLNQKVNPGNTIFVLDEIGYFELHGMVWHQLFSNVLNLSDTIIFTTKTKNLPQIIEHWKIQPEIIFHSDDFANPNNASKRIIQVLEHHKKSLKQKV